jgi:hypothetical protein
VVVVVVGASVVVGEEVTGVLEDAPDVEVVVVEGDVVDDEVVELEVVDEVEADPAALDAPLDPGCSRATTTPMSADAPVAESTAARVNQRSRSCARSRVCALCPVSERAM